MKKGINLYSLVFGLSVILAVGCTQVKDTNKAQYLPITATTTIGGRIINLEVTHTIEEQSKGLMYREVLPDDRAMLFDFNPPDTVRFWMKNVPVPLDIVFIFEDHVVAIAPNVPPCKTEQCALYPETPVVTDRVIEVRAGLSKEIGLKLGDRLNVEKI